MNENPAHVRGHNCESSVQRGESNEYLVNSGVREPELNSVGEEQSREMESQFGGNRQRIGGGPAAHYGVRCV